MTITHVLGVGIDLVDIARIERMLARHGNGVRRHLLTEAEWSYCAERARPAQHVAARLAAKEACFKALAGNALARRISWKHLEVITRDGDTPTMGFHGPAAERRAELGVEAVMLSLTHSLSTAGAVVILGRTGAP